MGDGDEGGNSGVLVWFVLERKRKGAGAGEVVVLVGGWAGMRMDLREDNFLLPDGIVQKKQTAQQKTKKKNL